MQIVAKSARHGFVIGNLRLVANGKMKLIGAMCLRFAIVALLSFGCGFNAPEWPLSSIFLLMDIYGMSFVLLLQAFYHCISIPCYLAHTALYRRPI